MSKGNAPLNIAFIHPDLGIGGAERLVVDAAMGIQSKGHQVTMYTSHHDPNHCFEETRNGMLRVRVRGDYLPRSLFGRFYILCAILRQLALVTWLLWHERNTYDVIFMDQLSTCIPLLKWFSSAKVLFYGHFPDALLSKRDSTLKKLYRLPFDKVEEVTTNMADIITVNSQFSASMFKKAFPSGLKKAVTVLYPPINFTFYDKSVQLSDPTVQSIETNKKIIVSINRFERKKNIELALRAFALLEKNSLIPKEDFKQNYRLFLAGGYDKRVTENVEYLKELDTLAKETFGLETYTIFPSALGTQQVPETAQVVFLCSFNDAQRTYLLNRSMLLLYTPSNEHFGIVPVEAMYTKLPVIATNTGGPLETVKDKVTGLNLPPEPEAWAEGIRDIIQGKYDRVKMGEVGRDFVKSKFSLETFSSQLEDLMVQLMASPNDRHLGGPLAFVLVMVFGLFSALIYNVYFQ